MRFGSAKTKVSRMTPLHIGEGFGFQDVEAEAGDGGGKRREQVGTVARDDGEAVAAIDRVELDGHAGGAAAFVELILRRDFGGGAGAEVAAGEALDEVGGLRQLAGRLLDALGFELARELLPGQSVDAPELIQAIRDHGLGFGGFG